ncbi:response regulator transcription factor [Leucobacter insecticola]|uniref:Response regulator transcription factor n=1 Tax=Leucobacter insecticola TaxID=2714934 RepID=A0A6G8FH53_9MICO|nr:response regulator transcription factor [Leucobacter insecticola]QIM15701.1 response regulator transcription factor [Leucobacter insecticola]
MIRVMVVDDHPIVRSGIVGLLETEPDVEVVAEAASGEEALVVLDALGAAPPDVVLMDLRMPGIGGVEATERITRPTAAPGTPDGPGTSPRVLVFTTYEDDDQILAAIEAGASGYLLKAAPADELAAGVRAVAAGVRAVAAGQTVLAPSIAAQLVARAVSPRADVRAKPELTPREHEILALVAQGLSNPDIAVRLFIGESTVKTHLLHVFEKLEVRDRTRAVTRAMELGILGYRAGEV